MVIISIFGIALAPLFVAIAQVESDNGVTSDNVYQITRVYVEDCNRILDGDMTFTMEDRKSRECSELMMTAYWDHYGREMEKHGIKVTAQVLADIHRYGFKGAVEWNSRGLESPYWKRVKRHYEEAKR